jgi:hypothetical protein
MVVLLILILRETGAQKAIKQDIYIDLISS